MALLDPFTLGDVGFQLSFAATLGLVLYTRPIQNAAERGLARLFNGEVAKKVVGVLATPSSSRSPRRTRRSPSDDPGLYCPRRRELAIAAV